MGKRKSMHPTPSEQRPFVYLMKRTTRRTPPSAESRAPFLPSYAPGGSSIPLFPSAATGQALVAKLSNLPTLSYGFPTPAGSLSSSISLNSLESRRTVFEIAPILFPFLSNRRSLPLRSEAKERRRKRMKRERERDEARRKFENSFRPSIKISSRRMNFSSLRNKNGGKGFPAIPRGKI